MALLALFELLQYFMLHGFCLIFYKPEFRDESRIVNFLIIISNFSWAIEFQII